MPTSKPRINVALEIEQYELISLLAELRHVSKSQVVRELVEASEEVLERVVTVLSAAERAEEVYLGEIKTSLQEADDQIMPLVQQVLEAFGLAVDDIQKKGH